jgi:hypothetical protein
MKVLKSIYQQPPFELSIKGKKYGYLDDSTDYHAMERQLNQIKKQGQYYPIIVSFGIVPKGNTTVIKYALYVAKRVR